MTAVFALMALLTLTLLAGMITVTNESMDAAECDAAHR